MSGEGTPVINNLEDAIDCFFVGKQCCEELKGQIAQLRGAVNEANARAAAALLVANQKIDKGERPAIVRDAVVVAEQRLNPPIQQAQGTANNALNQAFLAFGIAVTVQGALAGVIARVGALAAQLAALAAQLAGVLARIGLLFTRVQAIGAALAALAALVGTLLWLTGAVESLQQRVGGLFLRINNVERVAQTALRIGVGASESAAEAQRRADAAYEFANEALRRSNNAIAKADEAISKANQAIRNSEEAINKANQAVLEANFATMKAVFAVAAANTALKEAEQASVDAAAARTEANQAMQQAQAARQEALAASKLATAASGKADQAITEANRASLLASLASEKANRAVEQANQAIQKANQALAGLPPLENRIDQTQGEVENLGTNARNGDITKSWNPRVWEPAITPANQYTQRLVQPLEVGLNNFERSYRENMEGIRQFQGRVNNFEQSYNQNLAGIRNFQGRIDNFEDAIERNRQGIQNMQAGAANPANINNAVEQSVRNQVGNLPENIRALPNRVANLEATGAQANDRITNLENVNANTQTRINNQERVNEQSNQILQNIQSQTNNLPTAVATVIAATLPPVLAANQPLRTAITSAAATANCQTAQPGGCVGSQLQNINQNVNNANIANTAGTAGLATGLSAISAQITALTTTVTSSFAALTTIVTGIAASIATVLTRLGAPIAGGLSGGITRLSSFLGVDRILNLLNFLATVHNAAMLTNDLKRTLLTALSSVGNATGLLENSEGEGVDLNKVANQGLEMLMIKLFGAELWANIELTWKKYNKIYQAGANAMNATASMLNSLSDGVELIAERTGKIGNGLRAGGLVFENAYQWFSEKINVRNSKFLSYRSTVGQTTEFLNAINEIAETVVEGQEGYKEAVKATEEFYKQVKAAEKNPQPDNAVVKKEVEENKKLATKDPTGEKEKGLLSFLTDPQE